MNRLSMGIMTLAIALTFSQENVHASSETQIIDVHQNENAKGIKDTDDSFIKGNVSNSLEESEVGILEIPEPGSMGIAGDILYTASGSSSTGMPIGGHVALVVDQYTTIEAMGTRQKYNGQITDGVRYWSNASFKSRYSDAEAYRVSTTSTNRTKAVNYAKAQLNEPYNYDFYNKTITNAWYCSQLVWAAYNSLGIDLDHDGGLAVWPVDIKNDASTYRVQ
ncbi:YiiX/YebB-like N1pC/P60 family cysteine hydrolase [Chryseomicrobium palamuruense]|uniref:YiiX/YebB-like N1pC/P60 family cysteine hydrolase n=1 Tax=Chryseomicrobium palamuruense TaxID=682973 RepID=A0ABV8UZ44_9BACL